MSDLTFKVFVYGTLKQGKETTFKHIVRKNILLNLKIYLKDILNDLTFLTLLLFNLL